LIGVEAVTVHVEVDILRRLPSIQIVGLAASSVRESTERVRSALTAVGHAWPRGRIIVNLAPAGLRKEGTGFDLPIAVGILAAGQSLPARCLSDRLFVGELSLSGALRPVRGVLSLALMARASGLKQVIVPEANGGEAALVEGLDVRVAGDLAAVLEHLVGKRTLPRARLSAPAPVSAALDLAEVRGQSLARRALEVAAAGGHNLLLVGPPGCGKTLLASRMPSILPEMTPDEAVDVTRIHSAAGVLPQGCGLALQRPFRAPHHSVTPAAMVGGAGLRPGELTLAHRGVLFLDELPEFRRDVLELLRGPMENREVVLSRARGTVRFPAGFALVASANPCPCGFRGHPTKACGCTPASIRRYAARFSGPLMDRIDLRVEVPALESHELLGVRAGEASSVVQRRVDLARRLQSKRSAVVSCRRNAELRIEQARRAAMCCPAAHRLLALAVDRRGMSARGYVRVLRVARTIADLDGVQSVGESHVAEALQFRAFDGAGGV